MKSQSKGFGNSVNKYQVSRLIGDDQIFWRVSPEKRPILEDEFNYEAIDKRIAEIIGKDSDNNLAEFNDETLVIYGNYLKENLEFPCYLTGSEDFSWEESYVVRYMSQKEHDELRKKKASYLDTFKLLELIVDPDEWTELGVKVQRMEDGKKFELSLSSLEATDLLCKNYQLLSDYSYWFANYFN